MAFRIKQTYVTTASGSHYTLYADGKLWKSATLIMLNARAEAPVKGEPWLIVGYDCESLVLSRLTTSRVFDIHVSMEHVFSPKVLSDQSMEVK